MPEFRGVAEVVASIPEGDRGRALDAAARSYRETARNLGYEEGPIQSWVSAVMLRLQAEVKKQASTRQSPLKILHDELVQAATGLNNNVRDIGKGWEAMTGSGTADFACFHRFGSSVASAFLTLD